MTPAPVQILPLDGSAEHLLGLLEEGTDRRAAEGAPHGTDPGDPREAEDDVGPLNALCRRLSEDGITRKVRVSLGEGPGVPHVCAAHGHTHSHVCAREHTRACPYTCTHAPLPPALGPDVWGCASCPLTLGRTAEALAGHSDDLTSLALGPEVRAEDALPGNSLEQQQGPRNLSTTQRDSPAALSVGTH